MLVYYATKAYQSGATIRLSVISDYLPPLSKQKPKVLAMQTRRIVSIFIAPLTLNVEQ